MLALLIGLLAVYPLELRGWVLVPWCLSSFCMLLMFCLLWARWRAVYPDSDAVGAAVRRMLGMRAPPEPGSVPAAGAGSTGHHLEF
jgi:hypothetical protein